MTATTGIDWRVVTSLRRASLALRLQTPLTTTTVATSAAATPATTSPRRETLPAGGEDSGDMRYSVIIGRHSRGLALVPVNDAEHDGDENQCGDGGEDQ